MDWFYAILLGIIEGVTEFLPISSTGHLLVSSAIFDFPTAALGTPDPIAFRNAFSIFIQLGAVIAVIAYYGRDLLGQAVRIRTDRGAQRLWLAVVIAFIPAAVIGFLFRDEIQAALFKPIVVGLALIVGGIVFLLVERKPRNATISSVEDTTLGHAINIGLFQVTALIPGVSRSGASIVGGLLTGMSRKAATAFSFYLAIPTLGLATIYDLLQALGDGIVRSADLPMFAVGAAVSFVVAWLSIAWLLRFVSSNTFRPFGYYRIIAGAVIVLLALGNVIR